MGVVLITADCNPSPFAWQQHCTRNNYIGDEIDVVTDDIGDGWSRGKNLTTGEAVRRGTLWIRLEVTYRPGKLMFGIPACPENTQKNCELLVYIPNICSPRLSFPSSLCIFDVIGHCFRSKRRVPAVVSLSAHLETTKRGWRSPFPF